MSLIRRGQGFGLIELMIAMVIAVFVLSGLVTVFLSIRQTSSSQSQMAQLQDNERMAMSLMTEVIQHAGFFSDPTNQTAQLALPPSPPFSHAAQPLFGTTGAAAPGDTISVRFDSAATDDIIDCTGGTNASSTPQVYVNTFSVDASNELVCSLNGATPVPIVSGVTDMNIIYGVDTNATSPTDNGSVNQYLTASDMAANQKYWNYVKSVKITLTFDNPLANQPGQSPTVSFTTVVDVMSRV